MIKVTDDLKLTYKAFRNNLQDLADDTMIDEIRLMSMSNVSQKLIRDFLRECYAQNDLQETAKQLIELLDNIKPFVIFGK